MNDRIAPLRVRAEQMVKKGLTDQQVDREIMYTDHDDRLVIWEHVHRLRASRDEARNDVPSRIFAGKQLKARVIALRNKRMTAPDIAREVQRSRQRVEQIIAEAKDQGWKDPLER